MKTKVRCTDLLSRTWGKVLGVLVAVLMVVAPKAEASHLSGGSITYEHISANTYRVTLKIYRDCSGISLGSSQSVRLSPTNSGSSFVVTRTSITDITPVCPGQVSRCSGGSVPGYEEHIYQSNVTLNPLLGGQFYTLSWESCCRNAAITTLVNSSSVGFHLATQLNPSLSPRNSSPDFLNPPIAVLCSGQPATISPNAADPDGDVLVYSLTPCLNSGAVSVPYASGRSATSPLATSGAINLNSSTGLLSFTPSGIQVGVICTKVEEYRAGVKIGEIVRDIQVRVISCNNTPPVVAPITNQIAQVGVQLCVPVSATDANNDNITLTATSAVGTFTLGTSGAGFANGTFCFTPTLAQQGQTFTVTINAVDDACPSPGTGVTAFNITVPAVQCSLSINATSTDASCNQSDGSATVSQSGGINPISYNWSNGASTQSISGLAPGSYTVTVVDGYNCVETATVSVGGGSTNIAATTSTTNPSCPSSNDGSITVNTTGGVAPVSYSLNGGTAQSSNTFSGLGVGSYTITVTDASGCPGISVSASLSSVDNTAPQISCPATATVACDASSAPSATGTATATDNCTSTNVTFSDATAAGNCAGNYTITRTWTATDGFGNSSSCSQTINVVDNVAPVVTCSRDITRDNDPGQCSAEVTFSNSASDNCSGASVSSSHASGSAFPVGTTVVTVQATDGCGNASSCTFNVTVNDAEAPTIVCPTNITVNNDAGQCGAVVSYNQPQTADNCQSAPATNLSAGAIAFTGYQSDTPDWFSFVLLTDVAAGAQINFTDNGWFSTGGFRNTEGVITWTTTVDLSAGTEITILNNTPDVGSAVGSVALSTGGDQIIAYQGSLASPTMIAAIQMNGAWDATASSSNTSAIPAGLTDGVNAISLNPETDNAQYNCAVTSGASAVRSAANNAVNWNGSNTAITPSACGFSIGSNAALPVLASGLGSGGSFPVGTTVETYTVSDAAGNTATCSFTVTVEDAEAPEIFCPSNISVNNDAGVCGAAVTYNVTASDNCAGTSNPTSSLMAGGIAFVDFNADNPDSWTFVILRDILAGTQINFTDNGWFAAGGFRNNEGTVEWTASSNLTAGTEVTIDGGVASSGSITGGSGSLALSTSGDQLLAYQGSAASPTFLAGVHFGGSSWDADATSSSTSALPSTLTNGSSAVAVGNVDNGYYTCSLTSGGPSAIRAAVNNSANWFTSSNRQPISNCGFTLPNGSLAPSQTAGLASGSTFPVGTTTNTYSVTDAAGNTSTCSFDVTVTDNEAPSITCPADESLECLRDIPAPNTSAVQASDNCAIASVTHDGDTDNGGSGCAGDPLVISRSYTATDIYGNSSSCTQTISVESTPVVATASPNAIVFINFPDSSCATISVAAMGGCPGYTYQWSNGATTASQQVCPTQTTVYTVTVTDAEGCTGVDDVKVCVIDAACTTRTNNGVGGSGQGGNGTNNSPNAMVHITMCHIPPGNPANAMTKCLPIPAAQAHFAQGHGGDYLGACGSLASRACDANTQKTAASGTAPEPAEGFIQAFPNPFSSVTNITVRLSETSNAKVVVYDMKGTEVANLFEGMMGAGQENYLKFNASSLSDGMYFVRLITEGGLVMHQKVNLQK